MSETLALLVALPVLTALVPVVLGRIWQRAGWTVAFIGTVLHLALVVQLARAIRVEGTVSYAVGNFAPPIGIELVGDWISATLVGLVSIITLIVLIFERDRNDSSDAFYSELLLLTAGLSGIFVTGDLFNLYVFLEITGLATYALVATNPSPRAAVASLKYLLVGTIGASLYLLGVGYLYISTGTLNMADLSQQLAEVGYTSPLILTGFVLIMIGLGVKTALFPLHTWQPDAYTESSDSVTVHIAALVSTAAAYAIFRVTFAVFTPSFASAVPVALDALTIAALLSIILGSVFAIMQTNLKRMLAYSSVSQFGLVIVGVSVINETALVGSLVHLVGHAVMKAGLFIAIGGLSIVAGGYELEDMRGIAQRAPILSAGFAVLAFALVGVPPAVGFVGKWNIVLGAINSGDWIVAVVVVTSTLLTLAYFARVIERMYFNSPINIDQTAATDGGQARPSVPFQTRALVSILVSILAFASVSFGLVAIQFIAAITPIVGGYLT